MQIVQQKFIILENVFVQTSFPDLRKIWKTHVKIKSRNMVKKVWSFCLLLLSLVYHGVSSQQWSSSEPYTVCLKKILHEFLKLQ